MPKQLSIFLCLILALAACGRPGQIVEIEFAAKLGDLPLSCAATEDPIWLTDLRFYVSEPQLLTILGERQPITLVNNGYWQQSRLALIDLEDGSGHCVNGTPETNAVLLGRAPAGDYLGLEFTVGVPFDLNHADPLAAVPPLDNSPMHWHWRSGYKFLRIGMANDQDGFWMHVGSAACAGTIQNITGCRHPNRMTVSLAEYRPGDRVIVDIEMLLRAVDFSDGNTSSCSSGPAENNCRDPFAMLGLDFGTGDKTGDARLFRAGAR